MGGPWKLLLIHWAHRQCWRVELQFLAAQDTPKGRGVVSVGHLPCLSFQHHCLPFYLFCVWLQWLQRGCSGRGLQVLPFRDRGQIKGILEEFHCSDKGAVSSKEDVLQQRFQQREKDKKQQQENRSSTDGKQDGDWPSNVIKKTANWLISFFLHDTKLLEIPYSGTCQFLQFLYFVLVSWL